MPEILTCHEFDTSMNETTPVASTAPELNPCPNCGWSEADEQGFQQYLEYQQSLPEPSLPHRILRRIADGPVAFSDCWYFLSFMTVFSEMFNTFSSNGIAFDFPLHIRLLCASFFVAPVIIFRFLYRIFFERRERAEFENALG